MYILTHRKKGQKELHINFDKKYNMEGVELFLKHENINVIVVEEELFTTCPKIKGGNYLVKKGNSLYRTCPKNKEVTTLFNGELTNYFYVSIEKIYKEEQSNNSESKESTTVKRRGRKKKQV